MGRLRQRRVLSASKFMSLRLVCLRTTMFTIAFSFNCLIQPGNFRALQDTTVSLSSSLTNVGTVDLTITILKNTTYASANFYTPLTLQLQRYQFQQLATRLNKQPEGMTALLDVTNSTGYVTFQHAIAGSYTFKLVKEGYPTTNATIDFTGQPLTMNINLVNGSASQNSSMPAMLIIIIIVMAIAAGGVFLLTVRCGHTARERKIKELQRQLDTKY